MNFKKLYITALFCLCPLFALAQQESKTNGIVVNYEKPTTYVVGGVEVEGVKYLSKDQLVALTGLKVGDRVKVPSEEISSIVKRIWLQRYFEDVSISIDSLAPTRDTAFFKLTLQERPRVSRWSFTGVKSGEQSDLQEKLSLKRGAELSEYGIKTNIGVIKDYYKEKGFQNCEVNVRQERDTVIKNAVRVTFDVKKGEKVKIKLIEFEGVQNVKEGKLVKAMKNTRDMRFRNFFSSKKYKEKEYDNDKKAMIEAFNEAGFRDAKIVSDSMYYIEPIRLAIKFKID